MPEVNQPPDLAGWMREMERRLAALERAPRLTSASINDADGNARVLLGDLDGDGAGESYGLEVRDIDGNPVVKVTENGLEQPGLAVLYRKANDSVASVSATFETVWEGIIPWVTHPAIRWNSTITADPGTTGEARLIASNVSGTPTTTTYAIPDGTAATYQWDWEIPGLSIRTGPIFIQLQVRRTSGAGTVNAYGPNSLWQATTDLIGATSTGS